MKSELTKRMFSGFKSVCVSLLSWRTVEQKNMNVIFKSSSFTINTLKAIKLTITIKEISKSTASLLQSFTSYNSLHSLCHYAGPLWQKAFYEEVFNFLTLQLVATTESVAFTDSKMLRFIY